VDVDRKQRIHFILAEMCGNRFLEAIVGSLMDLTKRILEAIEVDVNTHPAGMHRASSPHLQKLSFARPNR
jgi:DNA-binding GntR family transcriptional regulator